jgi:deoxyribodipyrimidine photo-lyase
MSVQHDAALFWFRRDLRVEDNAALAAALASARRVWCVFVFDRDILDVLPRREDRRVEFIHASLAELDARLRERGGGLIVHHAPAREAIPPIARALGVQAVYANHDDEPAARARDAAVAAALSSFGAELRTRKDHVLFERREVLTGAGTVFGVFTPYHNAWLRRLAAEPHCLQAYRFEPGAGQLQPPPGGQTGLADWPLERIGFVPTGLRERGVVAGASGAQAALAAFLPRIGQYHARRDFPAQPGTSGLSVHLRFGTLSIRHALREAQRRIEPQGGETEGAKVWRAELAWRDFYAMILSQHPHVVEHAWRREYDRLEFENDPRLFDAWCEARTGYPIVDAAMRQILDTGYMHNRLRMIVASFLVKDLLVDWRRGERFFAEHLIDFDLASNNGGWQWAASTGCDAQPYFRIFNPVSQSERFDPDGLFIRRMLPVLDRVPLRHLHAPWTLSPLEQQAAGCVIGRDYPAPVVDHAERRLRALAIYKKIRAGG